MRDGLKNRIRGTQPTNTLSMIKKEFTSKNSLNKKISTKYCAPNGNCSNMRDSDGFWISNDQTTQLESRAYYAPFRQPLKGYRKTLNCSANNSNNQCFTTTEIYKDTWANCQNNACLIKGSLSNTKLASGNSQRSSSGISTRSLQPLIRSGMQPNTAGQQNSGITSKKQYSYSYHELIKNRRKNTYTKKLPTQEPPSNIIRTTGYGGKCPDVDNCTTGGNGENIYRLNNSKFKVQGAVESSSRLERLKYDTIRGSTKCANSHKTGPKQERRDCNAIYFGGKPRPVSANPVNTKYIKTRYTGLFNNEHTEVNYPQISALARVRGSVSHKTTVNPRGGVCCNNKPPQFLM